MTRRAVVAGMSALPALSLPARARAAFEFDLQPKPIGDGVWLVEGSRDYFSMENGGDIVNVVFMTTGEGVLVIDTGTNRRYGEALAATIAETTGESVAAVINTHHHPDHFFGNQVFSETPIYALPQTRALAEAEGEAFSDGLYRLLGDWMRGTHVTPPTQDLTDGVFTLGRRRLQALSLAGHTPADMALFEPESGLLITGDLAFLDRAPTTPHADLDAWRESLDALAALNPAVIVPGHGPLDGAGRALTQTRDYLDWLDARVAQAVAEGLSMTEAMRLPLPEEIAALGAMPTEYVRSIAHLYPEVEARFLPPI